MSFATLYKWFCFIACLTSFIFNGLLIYIVYKKRAGIGFYRYFTQATVMIGVLYSIAFAISQPFWYAGPGILGFFSIAPWNDRTMLIRISFQFWFTTFILIMLSMSASFLYRYGLLCSPFIVSLFKTPSRLAILVIFLLVFMVCWMYNTNYMLFGDSRTVRWKMQIKFSSEYKLDLLSSYALTVDINDPISAKHSIISTVIITIAFQLLISVMVYCGYSIHKTVKIRTMSDRLKRIHGRALNMMISQALNPLLFLYTPAVINLFGMFVDRDFGDLPKVLAMSLALFPIFNPMIVIYFTEEYKRFLLRQRSSIVQVSGTKSRDQPFIVVP